jgi:nucleoside-diphosphate-sugar epimerase
MHDQNQVIVTGGAGFIGSHLVDRLLQDGHPVLVIDDFSSGSQDNLSHHADNPLLQVVDADIMDQQACMICSQAPGRSITWPVVTSVYACASRPLSMT